MRFTAPNITIVTDISANIFALLILILIILLTAREQAPSSPAQMPGDLKLENHFAVIERTPLSGSEMVDLLYSRRTASNAIKVDLFDDGIEVLAGNKSERIATTEEIDERLKSLAKAAPEAPFAIYVFSHRWYRNVVEALMGVARVWREVSVPEALRESDETSKTERWSAGFRDLLRHSVDHDRFRDELARLLGSARAPRKARARQGNEGSAGTSLPQYLPKNSIIESFLRWWQNILSVTAILGGFGFIAWVEMWVYTRRI